jgi:hypothetical protein
VTRLLRIVPVLAVLAALLAAPASAYKVSRTPPPDGTVGVPYSFVFGTEGGSAPHTLSLSSGSLPPGLKLASDGNLSGTPTTAGVFNFYIEAVDSVGSRTQVKFSITIATKLTVTVGSLPPATVGTAYAYQLTASGGTPSGWDVSSGSLPSGVGLTSSGLLTGTPTEVGAWTFTVRATDGSRSDTRTLTLEVLRPLSISSQSLPPAVVGQPFTAQLDAGGSTGGYFFSLAGGALPRGLALDGSVGIITGTPAQAGTFRFQVAVSSSGGAAATSTVTLLVRQQLGFVTTSQLRRAKVGMRYSTQIVVRGGVAPVTLSSTSAFPPGLSLNAETGVLSGKPRRAGTYRVVVTVSDSYGASAARRFTIVVGR